MKLHHKLMIVCFVTIVIPTALLSYLFFRWERQSMLESIGDSYQKVLTLTNTNIDYNLRFYESIADNIMLSPNIQAGFENPEDYRNKGIYMMNKEISDAIRYVNAYRAAEIESVRFFTFAANTLSDGQYWFPIEKLEQRRSEDDLTDSRKWVLDYDADKNKYYYTLIRPIYTLENFQKAGYMELSLQIHSIVTALPDDKKAADQASVFVYDQNGIYVYTPGEEKTGRFAPQEIVRSVKALGESPKSAEQKVTIDGEPYFLWYQDIPREGWTSVLLVPKRSIDGRLGAIRQMIVFFGAVCVLVFALVSYLLARRLTLGLRRLHNKVQRVGKGFFYLSAKAPKGKDEVSELDRNFDQMLVQLNQLIQENYVEKLSKKEMELNFLQAQINPHFLYNTLDAIKNEIDLDEKETAVQMVVALADLFRISVSGGKNLIRWEEEIYHAKCYLEIHHIRFGSKIEVQWDMDPGLLPLYTLKIILQPILENAIQHGFKQMKSGGVIRIEGQLDGDRVRVSVSDNGAGMDAQRVSDVMDNSGGKASGVGLKNIHDRIQVHFGESFGLTIASELSAGTRITVVLPVLKGDPYVPVIDR